MEQRRLFLALLLSTVILLGWGYFFQSRPPQKNSNTSDSAAAEATQTPNQPVNAPQVSASPVATAEMGIAADNVRQRTLIISTPLYEVEIDSQGAVAKSWVLKQNKDTGRPLYSIASTKDQRLPLQLLSQEGLNRKQAPFRLEVSKFVSADDADPQLLQVLNDALNNRNYEVSDNNLEPGGLVDEGEGRSRLEIKSGEASRRLDFRMVEPQTGLEVVKSIVFDPNSYVVNVGVRVAQRGAAVPEVKMMLGPSIGDQGVPEYTFYSVAPQGVAVVKDNAVRLYSTDIHKEKSPRDPGRGYKLVEGPVEWAAVGDTYFAMALVLPKPADKLELITEEYQHAGANNQEQRFLISGLVPVPADGSTMYMYVGPKDHFALEETSQTLSQTLGGRQVDLEKLIDYGWLGFTRPIAVQLLKAIKFLNDVTGNYGVAIIIFTIVIYMLFFPLKWRSTKSMKKAQKHAPRMKELQEKIKGLKPNDPRLKELQMEQLRLMKEANPLGGCLPLLIQMPFLIALYSAITISIDFRQASFLWMPDLSAADPLRLLPILMAGSMLVLQLVTPAPSADPLQRKMMAVILPVMMLYMLWSAPSGLLVYWLVGNIVGFGQQMVINRLVKSEDDEEPPEKTKAGTKSKKPSLGETRVSQA
jgi:YidC/Oxa1 family membrane protein insertase